MLPLLLALNLGIAAQQDPAATAPAPTPAGRQSVIVVVGAPGTPEYAAEFAEAEAQWKAAAGRGQAEYQTIGVESASSESDHDRLKAALAEQLASESTEPLWLVFLGHGTFDAREAKFNLRGPDVSETELSDWLAGNRRPVAIIHGGSASGPFLPRLSGPNRIVVTGTRSGDEQNYTRLGTYLAHALTSPNADLDKDGQVSLLEAYLLASSQVAEFYKSKSRLSTEHALLDDNGDKKGTPPDWFRGVHVVKKDKAGTAPDGLRASQLHLVRSNRELSLAPHQRQRRDELETLIADLRTRKDRMTEADYYADLEPLMLELAALYQAASPDPAQP